MVDIFYQVDSSRVVATRSSSAQRETLRHTAEPDRYALYYLLLSTYEGLGSGTRIH